VDLICIIDHVTNSNQSRKAVTVTALRDWLREVLINIFCLTYIYIYRVVDKLQTIYHFSKQIRTDYSKHIGDIRGHTYVILDYSSIVVMVIV